MNGSKYSREGLSPAWAITEMSPRDPTNFTCKTKVSLSTPCRYDLKTSFHYQCEGLLRN